MSRTRGTKKEILGAQICRTLHKILQVWKYHYSLTGWSNATIALKWLKEVYLPETRP